MAHNKLPRKFFFSIVLGKKNDNAIKHFCNANINKPA